MVINDWMRHEIDRAVVRYESTGSHVIHTESMTAAVAPLLHDLQRARAEADTARLAYEENERDRMAAEDRSAAEIKALRDRLALAHAAVGALARMAVAS